MIATINKKPMETYIELFEDADSDIVKAWGGVSLQNGKPYIVFTPPHGIPHYSVKQEAFFKTFLLAAHLHHSYTGESVYEPVSAYKCYDLVFPREYYPFGSEQKLPKFSVAG